MNRRLLLLLFMFLVRCSIGEDQMKRLLQFLESSDIEGDPFKNTVYHLSLTVSVAQCSLMEVNDEDLTFKYELISIMRYDHPVIRWNPQAFGGIDFVILEKIWTPSLVPCLTTEWTEVDPDLSSIKLRSDGVVQYNYNFHSTTRCELRFQKLPYDSNECLVCLRHSSTSVNVSIVVQQHPELSVVGNTQFSMVSHFDLIDLDDSQGDVVLHQKGIKMTLTRYPSYYEKSIIAPMSIITSVVIVCQLAYSDKASTFLAGAGIFATFMGYFLSSTLPKQEVYPNLGSFNINLLALQSSTTLAHLAIDHLLDDDQEEEIILPKTIQIASTRNLHVLELATYAVLSFGRWLSSAPASVVATARRRKRTTARIALTVVAIGAVPILYWASF